LAEYPLCTDIAAIDLTAAHTDSQMNECKARKQRPLLGVRTWPNAGLEPELMPDDQMRTPFGDQGLSDKPGCACTTDSHAADRHESLSTSTAEGMIKASNSTKAHCVAELQLQQCCSNLESDKVVTTGRMLIRQFMPASVNQLVGRTDRTSCQNYIFDDTALSVTYHNCDLCVKHFTEHCTQASNQFQPRQC
jgi:hypothetical protein